MQGKPQVYIALPILNESDNLVNLLHSLKKQEYNDFRLVACVNQYDSWWDDESRVSQCNDNRLSITLLENESNINISIIDRSSKSKGWQKKKGGVGWARKTIMDFISEVSESNDIIISIDADTYYPPSYIKEIVNFFNTNTKLLGISIPYYHNLNNDITDRLILRYEIYMRYYMLNMMDINNPYCFTAIGSAMAFPVWAYKKVGGLTPVAAGEDFYFLQKLVKSGNIGLWLPTIANPSPRLSDRVAFGTGPALIKGETGNWSSYPMYSHKSFNLVSETYNTFAKLYTSNCTTPMDQFFKEQFGNQEIFDSLRDNYKDLINFEKACANKIDGLRILQFLRWQHNKENTTDENNIYKYLKSSYSGDINLKLLNKLNNFNFESSSKELLMELRNFLFDIEMLLRKTKFVNKDYNYA